MIQERLDLVRGRSILAEEGAHVCVIVAERGHTRENIESVGDELGAVRIAVENKSVSKNRLIHMVF